VPVPLLAVLLVVVVSLLPPPQAVSTNHPSKATTGIGTGTRPRSNAGVLK
jgi:hypothetical protein